MDVTYISTKTDKFNNHNCYFKITGPKHKNKLKPIWAHLCPECKLPLWITTDTHECMSKVKQKYAPKLNEPNTDLTVMLVFKYYCMEVDCGCLNQGFYAIMDLPMDD